MNPASARPCRVVFPGAPTIFDDRGELDLDGQKRCIDFMIDAGSNGICILANFSEQFVVRDTEREASAKNILDTGAARRAGGGRGDRDGDAAVSRRDLPRDTGAEPEVLPARVPGGRYSDHDPGRAG